MTKLSIVIPTKESAEFIYNLVQDIIIIIQSKKIIFEVIIVFDGKDSLTEVELPHVRSVLLKKSRGQAFATRVGVSLAQYDYVLTLDDDIKPQFLEDALGLDKYTYDVYYFLRGPVTGPSKIFHGLLQILYLKSLQGSSLRLFKRQAVEIHGGLLEIDLLKHSSRISSDLFAIENLEIPSRHNLNSRLSMATQTLAHSGRFVFLILIALFGLLTFFYSIMKSLMILGAALIVYCALKKIEQYNNRKAYEILS